MILTDIPVTFDCKGQQYKGHLSQVGGAGSTGSFNLTVNGFHWGHLAYNPGHPGFNGGLHAVEPGWQFNSPNNPELKDLAGYFGYVVTAWVDSHT